MAKLCTEQICFEAERGSKEGSISIKFDINVTKNGEFTTTLPQDIVEKLENAQIKMAENRLGNKGYLSSNTKDDLIKQVSNLAKEYISRELISEKLVIKYSIETQMSYQITPNGTIVPNGAIGNGIGWRGGTKTTDAVNKAPYGIRVYVGVFTKRDWIYKSGVVKTTMEGHWGSNGISKTREEAPNLHWLANLTTIHYKNEGGGSSMKISEMDYTEENAKFFVDLISSMCLLNERILPIIQNKNTLLEFINSQQKLIG